MVILLTFSGSDIFDRIRIEIRPSRSVIGLHSSHSPAITDFDSVVFLVLSAQVAQYPRDQPHQPKRWRCNNNFRRRIWRLADKVCDEAKSASTRRKVKPLRRPVRKIKKKNPGSGGMTTKGKIRRNSQLLWEASWSASALILHSPCRMSHLLQGG